MDTWAKATPEDREALFNQTASTRGISPEIVEKDFWAGRAYVALFAMYADSERTQEAVTSG